MQRIPLKFSKSALSIQKTENDETIVPKMSTESSKKRGIGNHDHHHEPSEQLRNQTNLLVGQKTRESFVGRLRTR